MFFKSFEIQDDQGFTILDRGLAVCDFIEGGSACGKPADHLVHICFISVAEDRCILEPRCLCDRHYVDRQFRRRAMRGDVLLTFYATLKRIY